MADNAQRSAPGRAGETGRTVRRADGVPTLHAAALVMITVASLVLMIGVYAGFGSLLDDQEAALENQRNATQISAMIMGDLERLETVIYRLPLAQDAQERFALRGKMRDILEGMNDALRVLQEGGVLNRVTGFSQGATGPLLERHVPYTPGVGALMPEIADVRSSLAGVERLGQTMTALLSERERLAEQADQPRLGALDAQVRELLVQGPLVFKALRDEATHLFIVSNTAFEKDKADLEAHEHQYATIQGGVSLLTMLFVVSAGMWILRSVTRANRRLRDLTRDLEFQIFALDQHAVVTVTDPDGVITYANDAFCVLSGYTREQLLGHTHKIVKSDEHSPAFFRAMWETITAGKVWHGEIKNATRGGGSFWSAATIVPCLDDNGRPFRYVAIRTDITARKRIEEKHRGTARFLRGLTDAMGDGVYSLDDQGRVTFVNPEAERLLGWSRESLIGRSIHELAHGPHEATSDSLRDGGCSIHRVVTRGAIFRSEAEFFRRRDGGLFPVAIVSVPLTLEDRIVGSVSVFQDITERKKAEQALREARDAAESANQIKSRFLANMSHEIRTPMNAVIGLSHLALQTDLSPNQRDYLEKIHRAAGNLLVLLNDLLDLSKIETGRMTLEITPFSLFEVLENVTALILPRVREKDLTFEMDLDPGLPDRLIGDPLRLGQILTNLLSNAVKFTEHGTVTLGAFQIGHGRDGAQEITFTVADTGIGMTEAQLSGLFHAFAQADGSITRRFGGTGLGLAISRQLAHLMGGDIDVSSTPDVGSTFRFRSWFRCAPPAEDDTDAPAQSLRGLRALVGDDCIPARATLALALSHLGLRVDAPAEPGATRACLDAAARGEAPAYDLVVLDWRLRDLECQDLARASLSRPLPAVLVVTDYGVPPEKCPFLGPGVEVLEKPALGPRLKGAVLRALGRPGAPRGSLESTVLAGARILLVEDDKINQQVARDLLLAVGTEVTVAESGWAALDLLADQAFDLVLMDVQMPGLDGLETTRRVRGVLEQSHLPIIAMTAHAMDEDRARSRAAGMNDHLVKPLDPSRLYACLERWLAARCPAAGPGGGGKARERRALPPALPVLPPALARVLDLDAASRALGGNHALLRRLLGVFATEAAPRLQTLPGLLAAGDIDAARLLIHTLKGTAATLGAFPLSERAAVLEGFLEAGDEGPGREAALAALLEDVAPVLEAIRAVDTASPEVGGAGQSSSRPEDPEGIPAAMEQLRARLAACDPLAEEEARDLARRVKGLPGLDQAMPRVVRAAAAFEFEDALAILDAMPAPPSPCMPAD
ncbi:PAS domain S-box protein [Pararhodospirillum oryzae]|uniref:Sensory/regulatory protein RpfC n=1 Tax=Pararhodospirillum oryzae TaxID=478448 RepID=A0A512H5C8_9PROT|nr:PAS domain S-box protein [Pararhodospirillum oryzae]GEO80647.1 hypothetical protein ROR02_07780 [Pararhodospirillum oryzae]